MMYRASDAVQPCPEGGPSCEVPQEEAGSSSGEVAWMALPADLLQRVAEALESTADIMAARRTSRAWRTGISRGVYVLKPRMEANAVGLQWSCLPQLQEAFGVVRELDLRQCPPLARHAPYFAGMHSLRRILISSLQRATEPKILLAELRELALAMQEVLPGVVLDTEFRFGEYSLLWGGNAAADDEADADIEAVSCLPPNLEVAALHMPQLCYGISPTGLGAIMRLTSLRHLRLVTYGASITDAEFAGLGGLVNLEHLWFGVVPRVTDAGLLAGLGPLKKLKELFLYDVAGLSDVGIAELVERLQSLEGLSLSKCHRLTNVGLASLARLPKLARLFLSENDHITCVGGLNLFEEEVTSLNCRLCKNVRQISAHV